MQTLGLLTKVESFEGLSLPLNPILIFRAYQASEGHYVHLKASIGC